LADDRAAAVRESRAVDTLLDPFWLSATMSGESLFFIDAGRGPATATLLFERPERLFLTSATGDLVYEEGRDYTVEWLSGVVTCVPGSRIPFATSSELYPVSDPFVLIGDGADFHRRQVAATYGHPHTDWRGYVPPVAAVELRRTRDRLAASLPLTICLTGDSISEGYNASAFTGAPPFQPSYADLVAAGLERECGSAIVLHNLATAGWSADDGAADADHVAHTRPDLVIIAFGMNDAGYAEPSDFAANVDTIMNHVRAVSNEAEFVLVSPMLPNPKWPYPVIERFHGYRDALAKFCGAGAALADLTSMWTDLLVRKSVHDLTGNGINHPNDFGHRVYAQVILALLVGSTARS